jgi:hypothetical protein
LPRFVRGIFCVAEIIHPAALSFSTAAHTAFAAAGAVGDKPRLAPRLALFIACSIVTNACPIVTNQGFEQFSA